MTTKSEKTLLSVIGKGTREAIDKATAPLEQRIAALERQVSELQAERNYKGL